MRIFSVVMTHAEALPTVMRHLPIWKLISDDIKFVSPIDSKMFKVSYAGNDKIEFPEYCIGEAAHHGEKSAQRIIQIFEFALTREWDYLLLMEYDSFAIAIPEDVIPDAGGVSAIKYKQNKIKFKGKFYLHYPMLFTRQGFKETYWKLPEVKTEDRYYSDRFIGRAVEFAGIPVKDLLKMKRGYSKNTIAAKHYPALKEAVKNGSCFFHGIKNKETLRIIK